MLSELKKSTNAILYERVISPLFGTFVTSWLACNWKIIYLTLFISEDKISVNKIDYIVDELYNIHLLVTLPLISTAIFITLVPFVSNGAFWLSMKFKMWRIDKN
ncbi:MAG: hypothetical protein HRT71_00165 [Flavobacteriales bacterium]|nr:hypothetical protein [Flavobacteriales bacterium]